MQVFNIHNNHQSLLNNFFSVLWETKLPTLQRKSRLNFEVCCCKEKFSCASLKPAAVIVCYATWTQYLGESFSILTHITCCILTGWSSITEIPVIISLSLITEGKYLPSFIVSDGNRLLNLASQSEYIELNTICVEEYLLSSLSYKFRLRKFNLSTSHSTIVKATPDIPKST